MAMPLGTRTATPASAKWRPAPNALCKRSWSSVDGLTPRHGLGICRVLAPDGERQPFEGRLRYAGIDTHRHADRIRAGIATPLMSSHSASGTSNAAIGNHRSEVTGP